MSASTGSVRRRESHQKSTAPERDPDREREREPPEQREPLLAELGDRLRDDEPAERLGSPLELDGLRGGEQDAVLAGRRELERHHLLGVELRAAERAPREPREPEALAGKSDAPT